MKRMNLRIGLTLTGCMLLLAACHSETSVGKNADTNGSRVSDTNIFKDQVRALERAEQVQDTIMDVYIQRNARMDESIGQSK